MGVPSSKTVRLSVTDSADVERARTRAILTRSTEVRVRLDDEMACILDVLSGDVVQQEAAAIEGALAMNHHRKRKGA